MRSYLDMQRRLCRKKKTILNKMPEYPTIDLTMLLDNLKSDADFVSNKWNNFDLHQKVGVIALGVGILYALFGDSVKIGAAIGVAGVVLVVFKTTEEDDSDPLAS
jgi:hypothetical protein